MATEVGSAFVSIVPSTRGFGRQLNSQIGGTGTDAGRQTGGKFGAAFAGAGAAGIARGGLTGAIAGLAAASGLGAAISKAGEFDKTIRTVGASAGVSGAGLKGLSDLALEFGAKTTFSAQGAADAMLELSKGGLSAAQIKAGALRDTLLLASAGGLELGSAAGFMVQGLTTFGLAADQGGQVASALAGAANASTASVESIGQALSQVGPGAVNAGLSIQETTAALAAFDNAGIKGSDAGTSLKTMLTALVPSTEKAAGAMADLGLDFTNQDGSFVSLSQVAGQLQEKLGGLSQEAKTTALKDIFGSDASRAAAVLASTGAAGIDKLVAATTDAGAAARMAKVGTQGYAGALEAFKGSVETAQIQLGTKLLPVATKVLNFLTNTLIPGTTKVGAAISAAFGKGVGIARRFFTAFKGNKDVQSGLSALVGVFTTLRVAVTTTLKFISAAFKAGGISAAFSALVTSVGLFAPIVATRLRTLAMTFLAWLTPIIPPLLAKIRGLLTTIGQAIVTYYPIALAAFLRLAGAFVDWIAPLIPPLLTKLGQFGSALFGYITGTAIPFLVEKLVLLGNALYDWIAPRIPFVITALGQFGQALFNWVVTKGLPQLGSAMATLSTALIGWILPKIPGIIANLVTLFARVASWIVTDGLPKLGFALGELAGGLVRNMIASVGAALPAFINNLIGVLPDWLKKVLGINGAKIAVPNVPGGGAPQRPAVPMPRSPVARTLAAQEAAQANRGPRVAAQYNGPITVRASDPAQIERQLEQRRRLLALA